MSGYSNTVETVASLSEDLVSSRSVWRKIVCSVLCIAFVVDSWVVVILHTINFTNQSIVELIISIVALLFGQYFMTGMVDAYVYWQRWRKSPMKRRSKSEEENKEAWVCMRATLAILGLSPVSRYLESLIIVVRMIRLERDYMPEVVAFAKEEAKQTSQLPAGSLISVPTLVASNTRPMGSSRLATSDASTPFTTSRLQRLDHGLMQVQRCRRRFRRSERDAARLALASGVLGAGPFVIVQGVLYFRRVGMNFPMSTSTQVGILINAVLGLVWLTAGLTHYYPVPHRQSELEFERGVGQVPFGGLVLLYFARLVHLILRCGALVLFTGQFYPIVLAVLGFHYALVLAMFWVARWCTRPDYSQSSDVILRSSITKNLLSDMAFSFVGLFEFLNGYAKYTRTRYLLFYFFYYLENASMMGAWYVHFTFPEMWYYLPSLLVITVVQLLGFILLQLYLYFFSRPRRKTTLCGFCFAHRMNDLDGVDNQATGLDQPPNQLPRHRSQASQLTGQKPTHSALPGMSDSRVLHAPAVSQLSTSGHNQLPSMLSAAATGSQGWSKRNAGGLCDPVFGQPIAQSARPLQRQPDVSRRASHLDQHRKRQRSQVTAPSNLLQLPQAADRSRHESWLASQAGDARQGRGSVQPSAMPSFDRQWYPQQSLEDLPYEDRLGRAPSVGHVPTVISAEEALEQELTNSYHSSGPVDRHDSRPHARRSSKMAVNAYEKMPSHWEDEQPSARNTERHGPSSNIPRPKGGQNVAVPSAPITGHEKDTSQLPKPQRGVFQPTTNQYRKKWPYARR